MVTKRIGKFVFMAGGILDDGIIFITSIMPMLLMHYNTAIKE
jgi:hypothetical protein